MTTVLLRDYGIGSNVELRLPAALFQRGGILDPQRLESGNEIRVCADEVEFRKDASVLSPIQKGSVNFRLTGFSTSPEGFWGSLKVRYKRAAPMQSMVIALRLDQVRDCSVEVLHVVAHTAVEFHGVVATTPTVWVQAETVNYVTRFTDDGTSDDSDGVAEGGEEVGRAPIEEPVLGEPPRDPAVAEAPSEPAVGEAPGVPSPGEAPLPSLEPPRPHPVGIPPVGTVERPGAESDEAEESRGAGEGEKVFKSHQQQENAPEMVFDDQNSGNANAGVGCSMTGVAGSTIDVSVLLAVVGAAFAGLRRRK